MNNTVQDRRFIYRGENKFFWIDAGDMKFGDIDCTNLSEEILAKFMRDRIDSFIRRRTSG